MSLKDVTHEQLAVFASKNGLQPLTADDIGYDPANPPATGGGEPGEVPPAGYYDAPKSSYDAAQYETIGGGGMNGYYQDKPHPFFMPAGPHNRPKTYDEGARRAAELAPILEAHQAAAGFTGSYPKESSKAREREAQTRVTVGEQDLRDNTEMFILKKVMGIGG